jgi:putative ABC transport system permease protein
MLRRTLDADLAQDLRYGARLIRRSPGFTLLAVAVLALGIGATTGMFSVIDALLIRQLPYREPERIVLLFEADAVKRSAIEAVAPANFVDWRHQTRTIEVMAAAEPFGFTFTSGTGGSEPQSVPGARVTQGFFDVFGMEAMYGRTFTPDEYAAGRNQVVVLGHGTWARQFGGDRGIVGGTIRLNGQPHTVVGVMPPAFAPRLLTTFTERGLWTPKVLSESEQQIRGARFYNAVARLGPGVTIEQAQSELDAIADRLARQHPRTNAGKAIHVLSLRDHLAGELRSSLGVLVGAAVLLLMIAMANTANLLMARASTRMREIAVRHAIGADRGRLIRQLLTETLLLAAAGCLLGLFVAFWTTRLIVALAPPDIPALGALGVNGRVLVFSTVLTLIVTILVGIVPAWKGSGIRVSDALSAAGGEARVAHGSRGRGRFVVAQLALALTLLTAGGLLLRSFSSLLATSPGFSPEGVAAVQVFARLADRTPGERAAVFQQIIDGMRALPQVREAGAASVIPFLDTTGGSSVAVAIDGRPPVAGAEEPSAFVNVATPGYFPVMRVPLLDGRLFDEHDGLMRSTVVVVSRTFADTHWRGSSPVGQRIHFAVRGAKISAEIIGVVGDVRHDALDRPASQEIFVPHAQLPITGMTFVARTSGTSGTSRTLRPSSDPSEPSTVVPAMSVRIRAVIPGQTVYRTAIMQDLVSRSLNDRRFMLTLVLAFAVLAAVLAASGVYGVMNVISTQRRKEYGLRLALGADRTEILRMVLREGAKLTLTGAALGLVGALIAGRLLRGFLFGVGSLDPWTLGAACVTLGAVAGVACLVPALKATRVSPLVALRTD